MNRPTNKVAIIDPIGCIANTNPIRIGSTPLYSAKGGKNGAITARGIPYIKSIIAYIHIIIGIKNENILICLQLIHLYKINRSYNFIKSKLSNQN